MSMATATTDITGVTGKIWLRLWNKPDGFFPTAWGSAGARGDSCEYSANRGK